MAPLRNGRAHRTHSGQWCGPAGLSSSIPPIEVGRRTMCDTFARPIEVSRRASDQDGMRRSLDQESRRLSEDGRRSHDDIEGIDYLTRSFGEIAHCVSAPTFKRTDLPKLDVDKRSHTPESPMDQPPSPLSLSSPLRRENKQLRGELKQLQSSLLDSLRRSDRFISGGQFKGKKSDSVPQRNADVRHLKTELRRAYKMMDDVQLQLSESKRNLEQENLHSAEKDERIERLTKSACGKSDTLKQMNEKHMQESLEALRDEHDAQLKSCQLDLRNTIIALSKANERAKIAGIEVERLAKENEAVADLQTSLKDSQCKLSTAMSYKEDLEKTRRQFDHLTKKHTSLQEENQHRDEKYQTLLADYNEKEKYILKISGDLQRYAQCEADYKALKEEAHLKDERYELETRKLRDDASTMRGDLELWKTRYVTLENSEAQCQQQLILVEAQRAKLANEILEHADRELAWTKQRDDLERALGDTSAIDDVRQELCTLTDTHQHVHGKHLEELALRKQTLMRIINGMADKFSRQELSTVFAAWKVQVAAAKCAKLQRDLQEAKKKILQITASTTEKSNDMRCADTARKNAVAELNKAVSDLQRAKAESQKLKDEVRQLKNDIVQHRTEADTLAVRHLEEKAQSQHSIASLENTINELKKTLESTKEDAAVTRQQYLETQHKLDKALLELNASRKDFQRSQTMIASKENMVAGLEEKLKEERQSTLSSKLQKQLKLQILVPRVSVSVGGDVTDAESAPSLQAIRKVMIENVLPPFASANLVGDQDVCDVQIVMEDMVKSIESKLSSIFGRSCQRTG